MRTKQHDKQTDGRTLPEMHNPLLAPDQSPSYAELVKKRRLGQTNLAVKAGQVGLSNATKPKNLGMFDYAHLRAPLPENLEGSEIFQHQPHQSNPEAYFLMVRKGLATDNARGGTDMFICTQRRSSDGFVSATGMFKAAFPWAKNSEEQAERDYIKSLDTTGQDEVAGNLWIPEYFALELAEEYGITPWIMALLDEAEVAEVKNPDDLTKSISPPPKFIFKSNDIKHLPPPNVRNPTPRARGRPRAGSPSKNGTTKTSSAPRKPRLTKASNAANATTSFQSPVEHAASVAGSESVDRERVVVEIESNVQVNGGGETTTTNVKIDMPSSAAELPLPQSPEEMIEKAKEMVAEARKLEGDSPTLSKSLKRKAEVLDDSEDEAGDNELQPAKKARILSQELKKERVRERALIGVVATLAIGAIIPYMI